MKCLQESRCHEYADKIMHEIKIAEELKSVVIEVAAEENLSEVNAVNVVFGRMIQVVPEIFEFAFRECVRGTIAENAVLKIEVLPVKMRCNDCGNEFVPEEEGFVCDKCNSGNIEIFQGREMFVKSIEGE